MIPGCVLLGYVSIFKYQNTSLSCTQPAAKIFKATQIWIFFLLEPLSNFRAWK